MRVKVAASTLATMFTLAAAWYAVGGDPGGGAPCTRSATTHTFNFQVNAAETGEVICLATGNYGDWHGTDKAITVRAAAGARPTMTFSFGAGDSGFTLRGMRGMTGTIGGGASNITIRDSQFIGTVVVGYLGDADNIHLLRNTHNWQVGPSFGTNGKIIVESSLTGTLADPSLTIEQSEIANGDLDGIHFNGGSPGVQVIGNYLHDLCDAGVIGPPESNHTDFIQFQAGQQVRIAGNVIVAGPTCGAQGITSFDGGTNGVVIEDNVIDVRRPWGIELYSDTDSIIRHNTLRFWPDADCQFTGTSCGKVELDHKSADPPGTGTEVYDNVLTSVEILSGSEGVEHQNLCRLTCTGEGSVSGQAPVYRGGANPSTHAGYCLASSSPGRLAASDGLDMGVRC